MKVLIVEDNDIDRHILQEAMVRLDLQPIIAKDGLEGWKKLLDTPDVSLLLTDYMMPQMNGSELVRSVRNHKHYAELPILIVSAYVSLNEIVHILDLGASRFLPKPLAIKDVMHYAQDVLEEASRKSTGGIIPTQSSLAA